LQTVLEVVFVSALLNDGTVMTISLDRARPSQDPNAWDLHEVRERLCAQTKG
jgi:hypothetical protein